MAKKSKKEKKAFKPIKVTVRDLEHEWQGVLRAVRMASWHLGSTVSELRREMKVWDKEFRVPPFLAQTHEARLLLRRLIAVLEEAERRRVLVCEMDGAPVKETAKVLPFISPAERDQFERLMGKRPSSFCTREGNQ